MNRRAPGPHILPEQGRAARGRLPVERVDALGHCGDELLGLRDGAAGRRFVHIRQRVIVPGLAIVLQVRAVLSNRDPLGRHPGHEWGAQRLEAGQLAALENLE